MSSHSDVTPNVECDDDQSSISSSREETVDTLHDDNLLKYQGEIPPVTTEEMITEAIRGGPDINDFNMDGCTNVTIGNQTHINGTVIIRNVLTQSGSKPNPESIDGCGSNRESDTTSSATSSDTPKREADYGYREFGKSHKASGVSCTYKQKCIILSIIISSLLIIGVISGAVFMFSCMFVYFCVVLRFQLRKICLQSRGTKITQLYRQQRHQHFPLLFQVRLLVPLPLHLQRQLHSL